MSAIDNLRRAHEAAYVTPPLDNYETQRKAVVDAVPAAIAEADELRASNARFVAGQSQSKLVADLATKSDAAINTALVEQGDEDDGRPLSERVRRICRKLRDWQDETEKRVAAAEERARVLTAKLIDTERERDARNDVALSAERQLLVAGQDIADARERARVAEAALAEVVDAVVATARTGPHECELVKKDAMDRARELDREVRKTEFGVAGIRTCRHCGRTAEGTTDG